MLFRRLDAHLLSSICFLALAKAQTVAPIVTAPAASSPKPAAVDAADYGAESYVIEKYATDITYAADGSGERLITVQVKVQSDSAVRQLGVLEFPYESRNEHLDFVYVQVRKPDGNVVTTADTEAQDQPAEVTRQAPFYSDIRVKQLPVKALSVGDRLEYQVRQTRTVAAAPGQFWYTQSFVTNAVVIEETASLSVPRQKYVQVESATIQPQIAESGDRKIYRWKSSQLTKTAAADEKKKVPVVVEQPPSIAVTTFKSWEEVGSWYGNLQKDRIAVTPAIQAKADELTKGIEAAPDADLNKISAIYSYVATQYRYIGVAFGIGRYQPHSADDVMQNQYGDCKDKHTLLASLLKAKGYDAWPALVGSQHVLQPKVPSPGQFDHVISAVTLNKTTLWMDSTPEVAPFQLLFSGLRDKQVLGIPNGSTPGIMKTPANPPFDSFNKIEAKGTLGADGAMSAHFDIAVRGDDELLYRIGFHQAPRLQWQTLVQNVSYSIGFGGTVSNVSGGIPEKTAEPFQYSYDYLRKDYSDWANRRIQPLIPPIVFAYGEDDAKPADTILLGGPVTNTVRSTIQLPSSYVAELPSPVKLSTDFAEYSASYSQANGSLLVERSWRLKQREIPVALWDEYIKFEKVVQADTGQFIQLIGAGMKQMASQTPSNTESAKLVQQAFADITSHNFMAAKQELDQAAQLNQAELGLWAGYGYLDISQDRVDDGIKGYQKELSQHPDRFEMYRYLAGVQEYHKRPEDAAETLRALLKAKPDDANGHTQLASLLIRQKHFAEAIPVLAEAVAQSPSDENLKIKLGAAELQGGSHEQGAALLRELLTKSTDKYLLNDAAYELADANLDLPLARSSCERALRMLDEATAKTTLSALTDDDLRYVFHLAATWDTMAWILYRQGDLSAAENFAEAAWKLYPSPTLGVHLGQIYEKRNKRAEASRVYRLAAASSLGGGMPSVDEAQTRLAALGVHATTSSEETGKLGDELAALRTVEVALPQNIRGAADFFVLIAPGSKVDDVEYVNGDEPMKSYADRIKRAHFDMPVPAGSSARIVRRGTLYCSQVPLRCQFTMRPPETTKRN